MPHLTFVRHGQCVANAERRVVGHLDSPLTALGHAQALAAADALTHREDVAGVVRRVVASDLVRARDTARVIADRLGVPLHLDSALREQGFGDLEGRPFADLTALATPEHITEVRWGGGESVADVHARLTAFLAGLPEEPVVLVTHGHVIDIATAVLTGRSHRDVVWTNLPPGGLVTVEAGFDGLNRPG